eukprot:10164220-Alexandrium_andersonii.AAC.1
MVALLSAQRAARTAVKPPNTASTAMRQRSQEESMQNSMAQAYKKRCSEVCASQGEPCVGTAMT